MDDVRHNDSRSDSDSGHAASLRLKGPTILLAADHSKRFSNRNFLIRWIGLLKIPPADALPAISAIMTLSS